ncbi:MAG: type II toxin-antitoxin system HicA family toxin [Armatimonadota bacterium]|nr:type II toxin-antitoxin system HicA family toxin [Armatimonadota bacterium]
MGKLRVLSGQGVCDILTANGFVFARHGKGDHNIYQNAAGEITRTVPVPMHKELAVGTLSSIIRQSGLPRRLFEVS